MKAKEALDVMWKNLNNSTLHLKDMARDLANVVSERKGDLAGIGIKNVLRETIEIYTRLGVIGALEEIE